MTSDSKITYELFIERLAKRAKVSETQADAFIHQFAQTTGAALEHGDEVQLYQFGRFAIEYVDEHAGHNPATGEAIRVAAHRRVSFRPYRALSLAVNWPFRHLRTAMLLEAPARTRPGKGIWLMLLLVLVVLALIGLMLKSWIARDDMAPAQFSTATTSPNLATQQFDSGVTSSTDAVAKDPDPVAQEAQTAVGTPAAAQQQPAVTLPPPAPEVTNLAAVDPVASQAAGVSHVFVEAGDTLYSIATSHWGDPSLWPLIYAENALDLTRRNPDLIVAGSSLRLPRLTGLMPNATRAGRQRKTDAYQLVADDYERTSNNRAAAYRAAATRGFGSGND